MFSSSLVIGKQKEDGCVKEKEKEKKKESISDGQQLFEMLRVQDTNECEKDDIDLVINQLFP